MAYIFNPTTSLALFSRTNISTRTRRKVKHELKNSSRGVIRLQLTFLLFIDIGMFIGIFSSKTYGPSTYIQNDNGLERDDERLKSEMDIGIEYQISETSIT